MNKVNNVYERSEYHGSDEIQIIKQLNSQVVNQLKNTS